MELKQPRNPNYAATVVQLKDFVQLANCDNVQAALIFGNSVIVGRDAKPGDIGLFFPVETQLSEPFLKNNNLYRKAEKNADPEKKGYFEDHGRIKAVKFRGHKSEGFFIPITSLDFIPNPSTNLSVGDTFDTIDDVEICRKYIPRQNPAGLPRHQARQPRLEDEIVPNQFRFHFDTENLRRNVHKIQPSDYISISDKWHGTSVVISKVLVNRKLSWYEKLLAKLGVNIQTQEYGQVYSFRKVIKAVGGVRKKTARDFYTEDIWGIVAKEVEDKIPAGYTLYGEIVGYTPDGYPIQKGYHYGCPFGGHKFLVYRVTVTNAEGITLELSWKQMGEFCTKYGLERVRELWYGKASELLWPSDNWSDDFLRHLEKLYVYDGMCPFNNEEVPAEGVVVRVDGLNECQSFKLKNFRFLEAESKQLDKGTLDIETVECEASL